MNRQSRLQVFTELDAYDSRIPLDDLKNWMETVDLQLDDAHEFMRFHPDHYLRNLMHSGPTYQVLVLCWRNGQRSPIHDHSGSSCVLKVVEGIATETLFERAANDMIYAVSSRLVPVGSICATQDRDIHQISNLQRNNANLVTIHVYSPPLFSMNVYSLLDASVSHFIDPINDEFVGGAGI